METLTYSVGQCPACFKELEATVTFTINAYASLKEDNKFHASLSHLDIAVNASASIIGMKLEHECSKRQGGSQ